jgi:hypothetical protein
VAVITGTLAGCVTTQQKAARLRLNSARILASQNSTRVTVSATTVAVTRIVLLGSGRRTAFVVTVRNAGRRAVSDLPISVGYNTRHHRDVYLNAESNIAYFAAHLPAIAGHRSLTWVYTYRSRLPAAARPFARVGAAPTVHGSSVDQPPVIRTRVTPVGHALVKVAVQNLSGIPQYQLPVYAVAERDGRAVAAGQASLGELAGDSSQTLRLRLLGRPGLAPVLADAPPTIFH